MEVANVAMQINLVGRGESGSKELLEDRVQRALSCIAVSIPNIQSR